MEHLIGFETFVENLILENKIVFSMRNEDASEFQQFSDEIVKRIHKTENYDENYKWDFKGKYCLVINDKNIAETLQKEGCNVLYIHMNEPKDENSFIPNYTKAGIKNSKDFENIIDEYLKSHKDSNDNPIDSFDIVINVSIPIYKDKEEGHKYTFETVAEVNKMVFETSIMKDKRGVDKTLYYTVDDKQTNKKFYSLINKDREKDIVPKVVDVVRNKDYGFDVEDERTLMRIFVRSVGNVRADQLDIEESRETGENISGDGVFVGRTNPSIYCFSTKNVDGCLKVGDTFRPVYVRMNEWQKVFGEKGFTHDKKWEWSAVENNWVFRDYTVHKYLKNMGKKRLSNKKKYEKYFTPISPSYTLDETYSNEFFVDTTPEDVNSAVIKIKKDIRSNIDKLRDSLKPYKKEIEEPAKFFYDERKLQKDAIDNFRKRITSDNPSKDYLIYAVMRFGKTYTAIRCLQEFYKEKKDDCSKFSLITTAKPEVKDEWIGGIKKYLSDYIDDSGKGGYSDDPKLHGKTMESGKNYTKRNFGDFIACTVEQLDHMVKEFIEKDEKLAEEYIGHRDKDGKEISNVQDMDEFKTTSFLKEGALKKYLELNGNKGKYIVLFTSLQDLGGSNETIKFKHKFFYDCPLDMIILDETHFAVRAKKLGASTKTRKGEYDGMTKKEIEGAKKLNELEITEKTIKLHLSGTPYNILKRKEFNDEDILAAFTSTHLRIEKQKWEKENLPKRIKWEEEQEELRAKGDPNAKEEWENPYSADKNPYFGIPELMHYGYKLSQFKLSSIKESDEDNSMETLFRVVDADTNEAITINDYKNKYKGKLPKIKFINEDDVIKMFRIIDGADREGEEKEILSILNIPEIMTGNMCQNILIALPFKDSCDALAELLKRKKKDGTYLFKILGEYEIVNAAGRRNPADNPINMIRGMEQKTITLTSDMLLTGVTVEPWDTIFYMKDGKSPESYDQAKFRVQSPYINVLPIFDPSVLKGKKPALLKQDLKPQTLFIDFKYERMLKLLDKQMDSEYTASGITSDEILKSTPVIVPDGKHMKRMTSNEFSDELNNILDNEEGDPGYVKSLHDIRMPERVLDNYEFIERVSKFQGYTSNEDNPDDDPEGSELPTPTPKTKTKKGKGKGKGKKKTKVKTPDEIRDENRQILEEFINTISIYCVLRLDRKENPFAINDDILGKLIKSVKLEKNKEIVHAVFFNNNFDKTDDDCVKETSDILSEFTDIFVENPTMRRGFEKTISRVESIMNKSGESMYQKVDRMFGTKRKNKLGQTELVSDQRLIDKIMESDFVIFDRDSFVLDAYGGKIGEFANTILNNDEIKRTKGIVDPKKYYVLCYTPLIYEFNKQILPEFGVKKEHIKLCKTVDDIKKEIGSMNFSVIVGNPPYRGKGNPLYMQITKTLYDNNMDENSVMCMINPTGLIDNKYEGNRNYEKNKERYEGLKLIDFYYDAKIKGTFTSAEIGNDIGIFIYKKVEDEDKSLYSDWVKEIRFGDGYLKEKKIADICKTFPNMKDYNGYINITDGNEDNRQDIIDDLDWPYYVVTSYNRGNQDKKTGGVKWDWTTILNDINLVVQTNVINKRWNVFGFDDRDEAVKWIKWVNTDLFQFLINFYKTQMSNNPVLYTYLPQPPASGDFSDKSLMKEYGLTEDQMKIIHDKITNPEKGLDFGYKTKHNSYFASDYAKVGYKMPSIKLDGTEETLLKFIDELNRLNKDVDLSDNDNVEELLDDTREKPEEESPSGSDNPEDFQSFVSGRGKDDDDDDTESYLLDRETDRKRRGED